MSSYKATLTVEKVNEDYELRSCSYSFSQSMGANGKPTSDVYAGTFHCEWEDDSLQADSDLITWARFPTDKRKCTIKFKNTEEEGENYREIELEDTYCIQFTESYSSGQGLVCNFTIVAKNVKIRSKGAEDVEYENMRWDTKRSSS